jgi:queuine tRNA-ribosyltransferase
MAFATTLVKQHPLCPARVLTVQTAHGAFTTPSFMPVGTRAFVNQMSPIDLKNTGSEIILGGNTYHMLCSPGMKVLEGQGGMHRFMAWDGPMLTDSGGFQVFSLSKNGKLCKIDEDGAKVKHPQTGQWMALNAKTSIEAQKIIGADIIMAFDQCTPEIGGKEIALKAMARTHRWLMLSKELHANNPMSAYGYPQALFGIVQGGRYKDLRCESAEFIVQAELDGIAIGGESIGFDMPLTCEIVDWVRPLLPPEKVRYTMGVGMHPQDLIDVVRVGIDIFDCVAPTRNARHGALYSGTWVEKDGWLSFDSEFDKGRLSIKKACFAHDEQPLMADCGCYTCSQFSRAYLHFLFKEKSAFYCNLATIHNVHVMQETCRRLQQLINKS